MLLRLTGWIAAAALAAAALGWNHRPQAAPRLLDVPQGEMDALRRTPPHLCGPWLAACQRRLKDEGNVQSFLMFAAPGQTAQVICTASDEGGGGLADWDAPWPGLREALRHPLDAPVSSRSDYHGLAYEHHVFPLGDGRGVCLVVNVCRPMPGWSVARASCLAVAMLLGAGLLAARRRP